MVKIKTWFKILFFKILLILFFSNFLFSQPNSVFNLLAISGLQGLQEGSIKLTWTYPGPATLPSDSIYYIGYATFTEISWSTANAQIRISTGPVESNVEQVFVITGLDNFIKNNSLHKDTTFYFVVWISSGTEMLLSEISNIATGWITLWSPATPYFYPEQCLPGPYEGTINLTWSGSGDDITTGVLKGYWYIQYSTYETFSDWDYKNYSLKISTQDIPAWLVKSYSVSGLIPGVTYYFRIWAEDDLGNVSEISGGATTWAQIDISPPRPVTYITVQAGFRHVKLSWIMPYEDSYPDGFLYNSSSYTAYYEIRWRNDQAISNESLWESATSYGVFGSYNLWPLSSTTIVVTGLTNFVSYYFAIKVADERLNWSQIGSVNVGSVVFQSSSPFCKPVNSSPQAVYPQYHFVYDPVLNSSTTVISSTTVKIDWNNAIWHSGYYLGVHEQQYGDYISSYTIKLSTYTIGNSIGLAVITVENITTTYCFIHNLTEDTTYYWTLTCYDSESLSSTTAVFKFVINSKNSAPVFPTNPLLSPTTVWHTSEYKITFSWKPAADPDPFDFVVGYKICISTDQISWYLIPQDGFITNNSTTIVTQGVYYNLFLDAENNKMYWYVIAYDSGAPLGYQQLSTATPIGIFWLNQYDSPPLPFDIYFPSGTPTVLYGSCTYYKIIIDGTTYYPIIGKIIGNTTYYVAKSTPIILAWMPTSDPDPEDGIVEYALFISTNSQPEASFNAWRYVQNPTQDYAPYEDNYWPNYQWSFFTSTSIVNQLEPGTQEGFNLILYENTSYYWRVRARDSGQNLYWIWTTTQTFSPPLDQPPAMFIVDFRSESPTKYDIITPTGIINPSSLEGPIWFDWTDAIDPDPFDELKYYFISVATICPQDTDGWFTVPLWKINTWLGENPVSSATLHFGNNQILTPGTTYYWQVHAWGKHEWEYAINKSTSTPYIVKPYGVAITTGIFTISNQKPYKFNLISPGNSTVSQQTVKIKTYRPTFYWEQVYDPDNYDPIVTSYVVVISSHANFSSSYQFHVSTTCLYLDFDLQPKTTYYWYVIAYDKFGNSQTPYSTFYFAITNFEPNSFSLVSPVNDEVVFTPRPVFIFQNNGDPDGDVLYYTLEYSSYPDFSVYESSFGWTNRVASSNIYIYSPWVFEENKRYFWRVIADDNFGGVTTSTVLSFWVNVIDEPPNPFDVFITSGIITQQYINFSWNNTTDNDPKDYVQYYKLCISSVTNYIVGTSSYIIVFGSNTTNYNFHVTSLTEDAMYQWWVEAYDTKGLFRKSLSSYTFIVDLYKKLPDNFSLVWPGVETGFVRITSQTVTFLWETANRTEWWEKVDYTIYLCSTTEAICSFTFSSGPYSSWLFTDKICYSTTSLQENTTYFWWVKATNSSGTVVSTTFYFFYDTQNNSPVKFDLWIPSGTVNTRLPEFKWQQTYDPDDSVSHYLVYYSTSSDFVVSMTSTIPHPHNTFIPQTKLQMNTTYYWKVVAYDTRGAWATSKIVWSFYVPNLKPLPVTDIQPQGSINTRKPKISWSPQGHMDIKGIITKYKLTLWNQYGSIVVSTEVFRSNEYIVEQPLVQNITYYIKIEAIDDDNIMSDSTTGSFFVIPVDIPQKVSVKDFDIERLSPQLLKIKISWNKVDKYVDDSQADDIYGYNVYSSTSFELLYKYKIISTTATEFTQYLSGENLNYTYYYGIKAVTIGGIESEPSDEILSTFAEGTRVIVTTDTKIFVPLNVFSELKTLGGKIQIESCEVNSKEEYLGIVKKYEIKVVQNGKVKEYRFSSPVFLEFDKNKVLHQTSLRLTNSLNSIDILKPVVFYHNKVEYVYVYTEYVGDSIRSKVFNPGIYAIRFVTLPTKPEIVNIIPKKIFTPTVGQNNKIEFHVYNPTMEQPEGEIYDLDLRYVAKLKYDGVNVLSWDGRYEDGNIVPKGIYIYKIKIAGETFTGSVIVAK